MSSQLKRVPLDFSWPLKKVWSGYLNPYAELSAECPHCKHGYDRAGGRPDANAALFYDQWYGNAPFDPAVYGAAPIASDDPAIWGLARRNIDRAPDFFPRGREAAVTREARRLAECFRGDWRHHLIQADVDALVAADRLWDFTHSPRDAGQALARRDLSLVNPWAAFLAFGTCRSAVDAGPGFLEDEDARTIHDAEIASIPNI